MGSLRGVQIVMWGWRLLERAAYELLIAGLPIQIPPSTRRISVIPPTFDPLWPLLRHLQLALPQILLEFRVVYKGRPLHALFRGGIGPYLGVGRLLVDKAADCAYRLAPRLWLQTGPCMPYGLWLRVATHIIIIMWGKPLAHKLLRANNF